MSYNAKQDIYNIYKLESQSFETGEADFFWRNLFQISVVFVFMTFVVFFIVNFYFITSQLADWYNNRQFSIEEEIIKIQK